METEMKIFHKQTVEKLKRTEKELGRKLTRKEMWEFWETNKIKIRSM